MINDEKVIQEFGELFGRYKTDTGRYVPFTRRVAEQMGVHNFDKLNKSKIDNKTFVNPFFTGPIKTKFRYQRYYDWQKRVIGSLERKNDVYVVAPPGGGKTTPLMAYWFVNLFLGGSHGDLQSLAPEKVIEETQTPDINVVKTWSNIFYALLNKKYLSSSPIPSVLFITPIRVLSYEQAEGFQEILLDLLVFLKSLFVYIDPLEYAGKTTREVIEDFRMSQSTLRQIIGNVFERDEKRFELFKISDSNKDDLNKFDELARNITYDFICVKTGGSSDSKFNKRPEDSPIIIATYGSAKNFIKQIVNVVRFIVYDEAHLYQVRPHELYCIIPEMGSLNFPSCH